MRVPLVEITARMPWATVNATSSGRSGRIRGSPPENNTTGTPKSFRSWSRARPSGMAQFIRRRARGGLGVAVEALEVALPGDVPDHHRLFVRRELQEVGRQVLGPAVPVTQHIPGFHRAAIEFGNSDHGTAYSLNRVVW